MYRIPAVAHAAVILAFAFSPLRAQQASSGHEHEMGEGEAMEMAMGDSTIALRHLKLTPKWPERPGDRARAESLLVKGRAALARYADVAEAERDGYRMFAPKVKRQKIYHYTRRMNALKARWSFDATEPTSLLYQPQPDGTLRLVGAMYTAPATISLEELDRRIPLSIAQWHQHVSICLPPSVNDSGAGDMGLATRDLRFGPRGSITTEAECAVAGGEFKPRMFNWMVHVNMFESGEAVWEHRH